MKVGIAAVLCASVVLTGCAASSPDVVSAAPSPTADTSSNEYVRTLQIYTTVIRQLVTVDHTFGLGPTPFKHVWVLDHPVQNAATATDDDIPDERFDPALKSDLAKALSDLPPLDFVSDANDVRDMQAEWEVRDQGVIITLGPLERRGAEIHVQHEIWCGGTCAEWFTYVLQQRSGVWTITGDTGMRAIA